MFRNIVTLSPAKATGVAAISAASKKVRTPAKAKSPVAKKITAASPSKKSAAAATSSPKKEKKITATSPSKKKLTATPTKKSPKATPKKALKAAAAVSPVPNAMPAAPANTPAFGLESPSAAAPADFELQLATPLPECRPLFTDFCEEGSTAQLLNYDAAEAEADVIESITTSAEPEIIAFSADTHMAESAAAPPTKYVPLTPEAQEWTGESAGLDEAVKKAISAWNQNKVTLQEAATTSTTAAATETIVAPKKTVTFEAQVQEVEIPSSATEEVQAVEVEKKSIDVTSRIGAVAPEPEPCADDVLDAFASDFAFAASTEPAALLVEAAEPEIMVAEPNAELIGALEGAGFEAPQIAYPEVNAENNVTLSANSHTDNVVLESATAAEVAPEVEAATTEPAEEEFTFKSLF